MEVPQRYSPNVVEETFSEVRYSWANSLLSQHRMAMYKSRGRKKEE